VAGDVAARSVNTRAGIATTECPHWVADDGSPENGGETMRELDATRADSYIW
jgi:hypothetical protein